MEHVRLGRTGLQVSRLCLGTMTFGFQCDEEASRAILDASAEAGITFIGPSAEAIRRLGDETECTLLAEEAGLLVAPQGLFGAPAARRV